MEINRWKTRPIKDKGKTGTVYCQFCGERISGKPNTFHHERWPRQVHLRICDNCVEIKPRCRICGLPMAADSPSHVCKTCSETMSFCLSCGEPVRGKYYEFDGVGPYCQKCYKERRPCEVCSAPLTDVQWQLSDGRVICAHCYSTSVFSPNIAKSIYEQMKAVVNNLLGLELNVPTGLALVDRNQLANIIRQQSEINSNRKDGIHELDPQTTLGLYARKGMRRGLYVQTGLPRLIFLQVAAHEFAHAWQGENCPLLKEPLVHEGFAEWVAYRVLGQFGYSRGQDRMASRDDLYGQGLRWALKVEAEQGIRGVILACRKIG